MQDEVSVLRSLTKNRDQLLNELDQKSKENRQQETQLKLAKNDLAHHEQQLKSATEKVQRLCIKIEELDRKVAVQKDQIFDLDKQKEQLKIESEASIAFLKQRLLSNMGQSASSNLDSGTSDFVASQTQFMELL